MQAVRLHRPRTLQVDDIPAPSPPAAGEVQLTISSVGVCGSDLHTYNTGSIGDADVTSPLILGHEFSGVVTAVGQGALDAHNQPLHEGQLVAVDPTVPCWRCEVCERGDVNLCPNHYFYGLFPDDGALCETMNVVARSCFPVPASMNTTVATLLEPLGVAIHAIDLATIRLEDTVAIIGCGPIGLKIIRLAKMAGAGRIFAFDLVPWRAQEALTWGADEVFCLEDGNPSEFLARETGGKGAEVVLEVAWADQSVQQAAEMAALGGRVVLVGIPEDNRLTVQHATARRKGLTFIFSRRMNHTYPRAFRLAERLELERLVTHRFPLTQTPEAYAATASYEPKLIKSMIYI